RKPERHRNDSLCDCLDEIYRIPFDRGRDCLGEFTVVHRSRQIVALARGSQIDRDFDLNEKPLAFLTFEVKHPVVCKYFKTGEGDAIDWQCCFVLPLRALRLSPLWPALLP